MGSPPKPLLIVVTLVLALCGLTGFGLGFSQSLARHRTALAEQSPAGATPAGAKIQEAQPYVPAPPAAPKAKAVAADDDDSEAASDSPTEPESKPASSASPPPPTEAAPGVPSTLPPPAPAKLPDDLPPT